MILVRRTMARLLGDVASISLVTTMVTAAHAHPSVSRGISDIAAPGDGDFHGRRRYQASVAPGEILHGHGWALRPDHARVEVGRAQGPGRTPVCKRVDVSKRTSSSRRVTGQVGKRSHAWTSKSPFSKKRSQASGGRTVGKLHGSKPRAHGVRARRAKVIAWICAAPKVPQVQVAKNLKSRLSRSVSKHGKAKALRSRKLHAPPAAVPARDKLSASGNSARLRGVASSNPPVVAPGPVAPLSPQKNKPIDDGGPLALLSSPPDARRAASLDEAKAATTKAQRFENPFGHAVTIGVRVRDDQGPVGELALTISKQGELSVSASDLVSLLGQRISEQERKRLIGLTSADGRVTLDQVNQGSTKLTFDKVKIELQLTIAAPGESGAVLSVAPPMQEYTESLAKPADLSMYVTLRGAMDYVGRGPETGLRSPLISGQYAVRLGGVVVEGEQQYGSDRIGSPWTRLGTRAVVDLAKQNVRIVVGDTQSQPAGFQQAANVLGVSLGRQYRLFDPSRNIFPTSLDSFILTQASDVEILVNGATVRRVMLAPGRYNLEDFPFVRGSNDVQVRAVDMLGRPEIARFNRYFDLDLLRPGLSEFNATAGFVSMPGLSAPVYDFDRPVASGFYRRGITNQFTLGLNVQADKNARQIGAQAVIATTLGEFGLTGAVSQADRRGLGSAFRADFQRVNPSAKPGDFNSLNVAAEFHTQTFATPGGFYVPADLLRFRLSSNASVRSGNNSLVSFNVGIADYRNARLSVDAGARYNFSLNDAATLGIGVGYRRGGFGRSGFTALVNVSSRLGPRGFLSSSLDTRERTASLAYTEAAPQVIGARATHLVADWNDRTGSLSGNVDFITNRADFGLAQVVDYDISGDRLRRSRTSVRAATAIAFADGAFAVGRPVRDAFAIVKRDKSLRDTEVRVDPQPEGVRATTGALGDALVSDIGAYTNRTVTIEAPDVPAGYDLGASAFRLKSPHKAGYRLDVGSGNSVSAVGILRDQMGQPLRLQVGSIRSLDDEGQPAREIFTNSQGRLVVGSLHAGRWLLTVGEDEPLAYELVVPEGQEGLFNFVALDPK